MDSKRVRPGLDRPIGASPVFVGAPDVPAYDRPKVASSVLPADVPEGGAAFPAALMADLAARAREAWLESGGSRARFEEGVHRRLGRGEGGRRILAALSLATLLQTAAVPAVALAEYVVPPGQAVSSVVICKSSADAGNCSDSTMILGGGAKAHGTVLSSGGWMHVSSGGVASETTLNDGDQTVHSGGAASGTVVGKGGAQMVYGVASGTVVSSWGMQLVGTGVATGTVISAGGAQYVSFGGVASGTVIKSEGEARVYSGGRLTGAVVHPDGRLIVEPGGAADSIVDSGGTIQFL
jgi:autotransporter passenger strand-loop-strand repeat protein